MSDELQSFYTALQQKVAADATARGELTRTAFVAEVAEMLVAAEEMQDWTPCFHEGRGSRNRHLGLDGYSLEDLELDGSVKILVADLRTESAPHVLTTTEVKALFVRAVAFVEDAVSGRLRDALEPSTPAADFARTLEMRSGEIRSVRVRLLSNGVLGNRFKEVVHDPGGAFRVEIDLWDLRRLSRLGDLGGRESLDIDLAELVSGGIPVLPASIGDTGYASYLCAVPGAVLARLYEDHGSRLLEGNVRAFLSLKGNVNKGIRRTIVNEPQRFFAFNNGITATASGADVVTDAKGYRLVRVRDLQIVNGGQTTAALFNTRANRDSDLAGVFVQMKLSVLPPETAEVLIPEISRYANTQNRVNDADLFANHPFHRRVEELSRRVWAPPRPGSHQMTHWFYERARAQYQTEMMKLSSARLREFDAQNPREQLITKPDLAKYENTWAMLPHVVSAGAQKNFLHFAEDVRERFEQSPAAFNERWFQHLVAKAIVFKTTEKLVSKAPWYGGGYRANFVTHGIARFARYIREQYPGRVLDLDRVWKNQRLSDATMQQILNCCEAASRALLAPREQLANVTEWSKKELAWKAVCAQSVEPVVGLEADLKSGDDERSDVRSAREDHLETEAVGAVVKVIELHKAGFWRRALQASTVRQVLSPREFEIIQKLCRQREAVPSDAQARVLLGAHGKLIEAGVT